VEKALCAERTRGMLKVIQKRPSLPPNLRCSTGTISVLSKRGKTLELLNVAAAYHRARAIPLPHSVAGDTQRESDQLPCSARFQAVIGAASVSVSVARFGSHRR